MTADQEPSPLEGTLVMNEIPRTERTTLRRLPKRGVYDREAIHAILDEATDLPPGIRGRWAALRDSRPFTSASAKLSTFMVPQPAGCSRPWNRVSRSVSRSRSSTAWSLPGRRFTIR